MMILLIQKLTEDIIQCDTIYLKLTKRIIYSSISVDKERSKSNNCGYRSRQERKGLETEVKRKVRFMQNAPISKKITMFLYHTIKKQ